jgi:hypothetical protein
VLVLYWAWGRRDLVNTLPGYGDALELVSGMTWIGQAITRGMNPLIYPQQYFPDGWRLATHSGGPILYAVLWPLSLLGSAALAFNLANLASYVLAFGGGLALARRRLHVLPATLVALAYTFWSLRWNQNVGGRLNIMIGSALLPWMAWGYEKLLTSGPRWKRWAALVGILWAISIMVSLYFAFLGGLVVALWAFRYRDGSTFSLWRRSAFFGFTVLVALVAGGPWLILNWHESRLANQGFYSILEVNFWSASLNALPVPSVAHPWSWVSALAQRFYQGPPTWEQGTANLGPLACMAAVAGGFLSRRDERWRPAIWLALCGLVLSLGLTLHWDAQPVHWPALSSLNAAIWRVGHAMKPAFFSGAEAPPDLRDGVPLPGLLVTIFAPFVERGRLFARYALAASLGVFLLAGLAVDRLRHTWQQALVAGLLVVEILPPHLGLVPWPPPTHPAFTWLSQQSIPGQGIAEVVAVHPTALGLQMSGDIFLASFYHHQASVTGASGAPPQSQAVINQWFLQHPHPFWHPDFAPVMRMYGIRYLVMTMGGGWDYDLWGEAAANKETRRAGCFPPPQGVSPWTQPICILEVLPAAPSNINLLLHAGWSGKEDWGVWAEGTSSHAQWVTASPAPYRLSLTAFPLCLPDKKQAVSLVVNGETLGSHVWANCDPWTAELDIPARLVRMGENELVVQSAFAANPPPSADGHTDARQLSAGFNRLQIERVARN